MNFLQAQKKAKAIKTSQVRSDFFKYIRKIEKEFFALNIEQIEDSKGSDNKILENKDSRFNGVYSEATEGFASLDNPLARKVAGEPYNFLWTGEFFKGFELFIKNGDLELFSTGTGSDEKAAFFNGYENLFGLTDQSLKEVIDSSLLPFFINYYRGKFK